MVAAQQPSAVSHRFVIQSLVIVTQLAPVAGGMTDEITQRRLIAPLKGGERTGRCDDLAERKLLRRTLGKLHTGAASFLFPRESETAFSREESAWREGFLQGAFLLQATLGTRTLGCEYELAVPIIGAGGGQDVQETIANILNQNGIRACSRSYSHSPVPPNCDIVVEQDGSIVGEQRYQGVRWAQVEVKTRILNGMADWEQVVPKTLDILRYCGGRITPSCGHHIHLGFPEFKDDPPVVRSLFNLIQRYENCLLGLVAPSRRGNNYCRPLPPATKYLHGANSRRTIKQRLSRMDRYYGLNLVHIWEDAPRIELRYGSGTLETDKSRHWARLCCRLVDHACQRTCQAAPASLPNDRKSLERMLVSTGLKKNTRIYSVVCPELRETGKFMLRRWKHFNGDISLRKFDAELKAGISR